MATMRRRLTSLGFGAASYLPGAPGILARLLDAWERNTQRRQLAELDDRLLRDIGISRDDARLEAAKRFWK